MKEEITKVIRHPRTGADLSRRRNDANRIQELRNALQYNREAFARACGVSRISASAWEAGKTSPQPRNWKEMAKLAVRAAPSTALWFWEKAGIERDDFEFLFPEFKKLARDSEQRIQEKLESSPSDSRLVPLIRTPFRGEWRTPPSPEQVEDYLPIPNRLIQTDGNVFAIRVSPEFVRPIFSPGDILVIDPSHANVVALEGQLVAATYIPSAETRNLAERESRGRPVAAYVRGRYPFLEEGIYLGWLKTDSPVAGSRGGQMNLNSEKLITEQPVSIGHEFSVPAAMIDELTPGKKIVLRESELKLLGRVVCWFAAGSRSTPAESAGQVIEA